MIGLTNTLSDGYELSRYLTREKSKTRVVVVPCSVDGNLEHHMLEAIVGFDTATKVYSQLIGNIMIDAQSAVKYWYFIRVMGRDPSHLVLECALKTKPNWVIISEEVRADKEGGLKKVVRKIADMIMQR